MLNKLIEYRIETPSSLNKVYLLWDRFFRLDPLWHFTLEGSYIEIRLSRKNKELENYLNQRKWLYTSFPYKDNIPSTRKYQQSFKKIFHGYAYLITTILKQHLKKKSQEKEIENSLERCIHLVFNLLGYDQKREAEWLMNYIVGRAWTGGYYQRVTEENKK